MNINLIGYRNMLRIKQLDMAQIIGITVSSYNRKEIGTRQFKQNEMFKIMEELNKKYPEIEMSYIFLNQESPVGTQVAK